MWWCVAHVICQCEALGFVFDQRIHDRKNGVVVAMGTSMIPLVSTLDMLYATSRSIRTDFAALAAELDQSGLDGLE